MAIARQVFLDLGRRGLIRDGDLDPQLLRALRTLSEYVVTVAVMGTVEKTRKLYARVATNGETGVLAVKEGESLRIELIRPTALAITLAGLLPALGAAPGHSVTITQPAPQRRPDGYDADNLLAPVHANRTANEQQMRIAASYLSRPRTGTGFFSVSGRDRRTGRELQGGTVTWLDTDAGRYLMVSRPPGEDGQVRSTLSPADTTRMAHQLGELIESVAPRR
jgi:ESX secretion-associated protein EspG